MLSPLRRTGCPCHCLLKLLLLPPSNLPLVPTPPRPRPWPPSRACLSERRIWPHSADAAEAAALRSPRSSLPLCISTTPMAFAAALSCHSMLTGLQLPAFSARLRPDRRLPRLRPRRSSVPEKRTAGHRLRGRGPCFGCPCWPCCRRETCILAVLHGRLPHARPTSSV